MWQWFKKIQQRGTLDYLLHGNRVTQNWKGDAPVGPWGSERTFSKKTLGAPAPIWIPDLIESLLLRVHICLVNSLYSLNWYFKVLHAINLSPRIRFSKESQPQEYHWKASLYKGRTHRRAGELSGSQAAHSLWSKMMELCWHNNMSLFRTAFGYHVSSTVINLSPAVAAPMGGHGSRGCGENTFTPLSSLKRWSDLWFLFIQPSQSEHSHGLISVQQTSLNVDRKQKLLWSCMERVRVEVGNNTLAAEKHQEPHFGFSFTWS